MANDTAFLDFVLDQLGEVPALKGRAMFGGHGLYAGEIFFGLVYKDRLYFKTDEASRRWYEERGMGYFQPNPRQRSKLYYEVPPDALESKDELLQLADEAIAAQASD